MSDISCRCCNSVLGWKYVHAEEEAQRYKIGKYILETQRVVKCENAWEDGNLEGGLDDGDSAFGDVQPEAEVEFDSQDEDECEDLFSGVWSPELARKRRRNRDFRTQ